MEMTSQASPSSVSATTPIDDGEDGPNGLDPNRWFFEKERLEFTPSRKCGIDADKELAYRQQSANFIQDMGQRLQVNQLCINTAIVYMHRFYMYHSFSHFHRNHVSTASIFLAAKVEEQPRKLEHVIKVAHYCLNRESQPIDVKSENYAEQTSELVMTENILLQTLGFDVAIDHPHTHVVKCCQLVRASKDLAQTSYFMATNSLHLTTMCLQYKPTVVACVCIHMTCKWSNWEIPRSKEGRDWFWYVDDSVTMDQLEKLTTEFLTIFDKSPSRLKKKIISLNQASGGTSSLTLSSFPTFNLDPTSPGAPQFPPARSHSPATTATSHYGSSSSLGKRSSSSLKPSGSQINNKQGKVNGGIGHHPVKPPHGSQNPPSNSSSSSKHPHFSASSSSSSSSSSKGILPPGSHHGAKDAHIQQQAHAKQSGHHHSSSGHGPQAYPHGTSNRPSSSHSHPSGHLSQSHAPPAGQPPKPISASTTSSSSTSSHSMSGQHPPKSQLPQPSKVPYNYNIKSQPPPPQQIPSSGLPPSKSSSSSLSQSSSNPPSSKIHTQPPPYNQIKKPYPDASRRENSSTGDFNGKRESSDDMNRRNNANSQSRSRPSDKTGDLFTTGAGSMSNLPPVSLPFNASTTAEPTTRSWVDTSSSITSNNTNNVSIIEPPRIPPGRTSLFSPDPEIPETSSISSSIQSIVKRELSPLGGGDVVGLGGAKGDHSTDAFAAHTSSMGFPTLFEFGRSSSSSNDPTSFITDLKPDLGLGGSSSSVGVSGIFGSGGNHNNSDMIITDASVLTSSLSSAPVSTSTLSSVTMPMNSMTCSNISLTSPINPGGGLLPPDMLDASGGEPPHKKSKKNKKEKHKHKEKDKDKHHEDKKEKKDKDEKKRNKDKNKDKSKEDKKHKEKGDKEKHKKDKHKDKDRDKSSKGSSKHSGPSEASSPGYPDLAGNKIKFTIGSRPIEVPTQEKSKSKHSSKKHSSKSSTAPSSETSSSSAPASTPSIKLKIVPVRPPSSKDDSKLVFASKQN